MCSTRRKCKAYNAAGLIVIEKAAFCHHKYLYIYVVAVKNCSLLSN